jgi:hypothetical protein
VKLHIRNDSPSSKNLKALFAYYYYLKVIMTKALTDNIPFGYFYRLSNEQTCGRIDPPSHTAMARQANPPADILSSIKEAIRIRR